MTEMTCWSCRHSQGSLRFTLVCRIYKKPVSKAPKCADFQYEPGTDECERSKKSVRISSPDITGGRNG